MTRWLDGIGRVTVKAYTGATLRGDFVMAPDGVTPIGYCRAPGWMQVEGWCHVKLDTMPENSGVIIMKNREQMAARARYRHAQRHGPRAARSKGYGPNYSRDVEAYDPNEAVN